MFDMFGFMGSYGIFRWRWWKSRGHQQNRGYNPPIAPGNRRDKAQRISAMPCHASAPRAREEFNTIPQAESLPNSSAMSHRTWIHLFNQVAPSSAWSAQQRRRKSRSSSSPALEVHWHAPFLHLYPGIFRWSENGLFARSSANCHSDLAPFSVSDLKTINHHVQWFLTNPNDQHHWWFQIQPLSDSDSSQPSFLTFNFSFADSPPTPINRFHACTKSGLFRFVAIHWVSIAIKMEFTLGRTLTLRCLSCVYANDCMVEFPSDMFD